MKSQIAPLIIKARQRQGLTKEAAAKKLGISPHYLGHLETLEPKHPVHLSDRLAVLIMGILGVPVGLKSAQKRHNAAVLRYYRKHRY